MARELTPADLTDLLRDTTRREAKPTPVSMRAALARGGVAGVGTAMVLAGGMLWPQTVDDVRPLVAGVIVAGAVMVVYAIPTDRIAPWLLAWLLPLRRVQQVQATVYAAEFRKRKAYEAIERLEAEHAAAIEEWRRAVTELRAENKSLRSELTAYQKERRTQTYVTRSDVAAETVKDATTIIEHWYATARPNKRGEWVGEWWSRPKAQAAGWTKTRHEAATTLLLDTGITGLNEKLPFVKMQEYPDLSAALYRLHTYVKQTEREPDAPRRDAHYVESDNG